jgi:hypothetical protein
VVTGHIRRAALLGAATILAVLALSSEAGAYVYWTDATDGSWSIGRANLDGSGVDPGFISGLGNPCGVAVDAGHVYWGNRATNSIGRANLDGSGANPTFIVNNDPTVGFPCSPAIGGGRIWWANFLSNNPGEGSIARANLDGTGVQSTFFNSPSNAASPLGVALSGTQVLWSNTDLNGTGTPSPNIASAGTDGTPPPNLGFIPFSSPLVPSWLAANGTHVYAAVTVSGLSGFHVERFKLDGTSDTPAAFQRIDGSGGVAVDPGHLYWANFNEGTISRGNLDGSSPDFAYIRTGDLINGIAVDAGVPSNDFTIGKAKRNRRRGTARLPLTLSGPGSVSLAGKGVGPRTVQAQGSNAELTVGATGKQARKLKRGGKVAVSVAVTYTPTGGVARTEQAKVKLVRRART